MNTISDDEVRELYARVPSMDKKKIIEISERFDIYYVKRASVIQSQHALQVGLKKKFAKAFTGMAEPKPKKARTPTPPELQYNDRMYIFLKARGLRKDVLSRFHLQFSSMTLCNSGVDRFAREADEDMLLAVMELVFPELEIFKDETSRDVRLRQWLTSNRTAFQDVLRNRCPRVAGPAPVKSKKRSYPNRMYTRLKERGLSPAWLSEFHHQFSALTLNITGIETFVRASTMPLLLAVLDIVDPYKDWYSISEDEVRSWAEANVERIHDKLKRPAPANGQ